MITNTYTYYAGGQLATEATPQWASSTVTLGYTSRLRTSLTLAQPTIGNWTHSYTWDSARRLGKLTGSSGQRCWCASPPRLQQAPGVAICRGSLPAKPVIPSDQG